MYVDGDKENRQLEEELRNKEDLLRNEQEEKRRLREKLVQMEKGITPTGPDSEDKREMEKIRRLKDKLKTQKRREEEFKKEK